MTNKISICIPFYETHDLTISFLKSIVHESFVDEIIISDDCSKEEFKYKHPKIKIFRNKFNQGAFHNKFITVSKATNNWALLLDSDNFIDLTVLKKIFEYKYNKNFFYLPQKLYLESLENYGNEMHNKIINYDFLEKNEIDLNIASSFLKKNNKKIEWLLNTGNFIVNRNEYIKVNKKIFYSQKRKLLDCDALAFTYYWLINKKKIKILDFYYIRHRLRKDSWTNTAKDNWNSQKYYIFLIKNKNNYKLIYYLYLLFSRLWHSSKKNLKKFILS